MSKDGKTLYDIAKEATDFHMMDLLIQFHPGSMIKVKARNIFCN